MLQSWSKASLGQKIQIAKRLSVQIIGLITVGVVFFWATFLVIWIGSMLVGVQPYFVRQTPNFHVRPLMPNSLVAVYVNQAIKHEACSLGPQHFFFSELTVPFHEYCNIEQEQLPRMRAPVDISLDQIDTSNIMYVTGCIKHRTKQISCQKYQANYQMHIFRNLQFHGLYYMQIQLHLRNPTNPLPYTPSVEFQERVSLITKLIKKYYNAFTLIFCFGVATFLTVSIAILRFIKVAQNYCNQEPQPKRTPSKISLGSTQKSYSRASDMVDAKNPKPVSNLQPTSELARRTERQAQRAANIKNNKIESAEKQISMIKKLS